MAKGLFTALFNALSDPKSYYAMQKEMNLQAVAQTFFNSLAGKTSFDAVILPENLGESVVFDGKRAVRVRPLGIYDFIIPEPCEFEDPETRKRILSLHPIAYPDSTEGGKIQTSDPQPFKDARVVECFFKNGPQSSGKLRGLTYRPNITRKFSGTGINYECLYSSSEGNPKKPSSSQAAFKRGDYASYEPTKEASSGVLKFLRDKDKAYVSESTSKNIIKKTSDGVSHQPIKKTYKGSIKDFKGKLLENGLLPQELIGQSISASGFPALFLKDVINDFDRLAIAFKNKFNQNLVLNDSYRTFNEQIKIKDKKLREAKSISDPEKARKKKGEAAKPGTSNHGWGLAFDFNTHYQGKSGFQSETYNWMLYNAPRFGFHSPLILRDGAGTDESWHIEWKDKNKIWRN